ncbi:hypothetical protein BDN72DRAFT_270326 [Pluteus cervinus]|uniref:Uncharacterized protein n=1 Tax=Pluteus cervinus TaxID=181527 RepID=A0ACD3B5K0_9AGAR|nr:hypothetical protein BDN72DRAFT_270326 [Pluteus cervinus]
MHRCLFVWFLRQLRRWPWRPCIFVFRFLWARSVVGTSDRSLIYPDRLHLKLLTTLKGRGVVVWRIRCVPVRGMQRNCNHPNRNWRTKPGKFDPIMYHLWSCIMSRSSTLHWKGLVYLVSLR